MFKKWMIASLLLITGPSFANLPYYPIQFPRDDYAHHDNVPYPLETLTEWWYFNGKLVSKQGKEFGYYISYFYEQFYLGMKKIIIPMFMLQVTDLATKKVYGNLSVFPENQTQFPTSSLNIKLGKEISLSKTEDTFFLKAKLKDKWTHKNLDFALQLRPKREPLLINKMGMVDMGAGTNSYYYSYTELATHGIIYIGNEKYEVIDSSLSWFDHQWGDFVNLPGRNQWFWASVQLENNMEINLAATFDPQKKEYVGGYADIIFPDNSRIYLENPQITATLAAGEKYPSYYEITLPTTNLKLSIKTLAPKQNINWISEAASTATLMMDGQVFNGYANAESSVIY